MIWEDRSLLPLVDPRIVGSFTVGSVIYDLVKYTQAKGAASWTYLAFIPRSTVSTSDRTVDLMPFLTYLKTNNHINSSDYLSNVSFGNEIIEGAGATTIFDFSVSLTTDAPNYLINDDFESYAVNTFPSSGGWSLLVNGAGNQYQVVTTSQAHTGSQSMQLKGRNWWASNMGKTIKFTQSVFFCEVWVRASASSTGQLEDRGEIRFVHVTSGDWTYFGGVYLSAEHGQIKAYVSDRINNQITIQSYNANHWYKLKFKLDVPQQKLSVWVDDVLKLDNYRVAFPSIGFNSFQLTAEHGNTTFWYDNLKVWKECFY